MSLVLRNLQRVVPLRRARLRHDVELLRRIARIEKFDLGLVCVDNRRIQRINSIYRRINMPTDVLSFPFYEASCCDNLTSLTSDLPRDELNLGDIFLGVEYILTQCQESSEDFYSNLTVITLHGICHLLGYKHGSDDKWIEMFQKEKHILSEFNRLTGSRLEPLTTRFSS
ncbi:putative ribonuclease [Arapaima gigas]